MAMIAIHFCPHSTAGLNEPFSTNFLSFGCSWFYFLCNFLFHFLVLLRLHCNYLHNYTCSDLCFPAPRCIIETSDPTQLHFNIYVNFNSSCPSSSITKKNFIWIFPQEELFFLPFPQHIENADILYCFCWMLLPYIWTSLFFFNLIYLKKNLRWWSLAYIQLILIISLDRMSYFE